MVNNPKYRITVYHRPWYLRIPFVSEVQVGLEIFDKRSNKYKPVKAIEVSTRDAQA